MANRHTSIGFWSFCFTNRTNLGCLRTNLVIPLWKALVFNSLYSKSFSKLHLWHFQETEIKGVAKIFYLILQYISESCGYVQLLSKEKILYMLLVHCIIHKLCLWN